MVTSWLPEHERISRRFLHLRPVCWLAFLDPAIKSDSGKCWLALGIYQYRRYQIVWSLDLIKVYQPPRSTKSISKAELDYIRDGGGLVDGDAPAKGWRGSR